MVWLKIAFESMHELFIISLFWQLFGIFFWSFDKLLFCDELEIVIKWIETEKLI